MFKQRLENTQGELCEGIRNGIHPAKAEVEIRVCSLPCGIIISAPGLEGSYERIGACLAFVQAFDEPER